MVEATSELSMRGGGWKCCETVIGSLNIASGLSEVAPTRFDWVQNGLIKDWLILDYRHSRPMLRPSKCPILEKALQVHKGPLGPKACRALAETSYN
jgi:hypothetical protein